MTTVPDLSGQSLGGTCGVRWQLSRQSTAFEGGGLAIAAALTSVARCTVVSYTNND